MKSSVKIAFLVSSLLLTSCGTSRFEDIRVNSGDIRSLNIGLDGKIQAEVVLEVDNPAREFSVSSLSGTLKTDGSPLLLLECPEKVDVPKGECGISFSVTGKKAEGVGIFKLMSLLSASDAGNMTVDFSARVSLRSGFGKTLEYKDIPLDDIPGLK